VLDLAIKLRYFDNFDRNLMHDSIENTVLLTGLIKAARSRSRPECWFNNVVV